MFSSDHARTCHGQPALENRPEGSNWGDFGPDDQIGRMNLLTPATRLPRCARSSDGVAFCLSLPLDYPGRQHAVPAPQGAAASSTRNAATATTTTSGCRTVCDCFSDVVSDDAVMMYTQYSTQWDGLGHVGQMFDADGDGLPEKVYYNGYRAGIDVIGPDDDRSESAWGAQGDRHRTPGHRRRAGPRRAGRPGEACTAATRALVGYDGLMAALDAQGATRRSRRLPVPVHRLRRPRAGDEQEARRRDADELLRGARRPRRQPAAVDHRLAASSRSAPTTSRSRPIRRAPARASTTPACRCTRTACSSWG